MSLAFQADAFQNNAFQTTAPTNVTGTFSFKGTITQKIISNVTGTFAFKETIDESSLHYHTVGRIAFLGTIDKNPRYFLRYENAWKGTPRIVRLPSPKDALGKFSFKGSASLAGPPSPQNVSGKWALREHITFGSGFYPADQSIRASTPLNVLPEIGSGLFIRWSVKREKVIFVNRGWDARESGREKRIGTRWHWDLEMECSAVKRDEIWTFINDHLGAGKAFYFYDLQANNFQYDPTGVLTTGRYLCRFVPDEFPVEFRLGYRFRIGYSIVEVV